MTKYFYMALIFVFFLSGGCGNHPAWKYNGEFHKAIANADRVVVFDDGFDCFGKNTKAKPLFELSKPDEIKQLAEQLVFEKGQTLDVCYCNGYPRVDWYRGKERLATVSIQHCKAVRWKGFQADGKLTSKSGQWLKQWLVEKGVDQEKMK
jgi:hypothetical protein